MPDKKPFWQGKQPGSEPDGWGGGVKYSKEKGLEFYDGRGNPSSFAGAFSDGSVPTGPSIPSNVTGNPPRKPVANMAADQAEKAASNALKKMNE